MLLNMDFSKPVAVPPAEQDWVTSPADGVSRVHLEREADESGHTTSLVRFAPDASFPRHAQAASSSMNMAIIRRVPGCAVHTSVHIRRGSRGPRP